MHVALHMLAVAAFSAIAHAQTHSPRDIPLDCGHDLFPSMIEKASCYDIICLCCSDDWRSQTATAISNQCATSLSLASDTVTAICNAPIRDISQTLDVTTMVMIGITASLMFSRLIYKKFFSSRRKLEPDDYAVIAALFIYLIASLMNYVALDRSGLGRDIWTLSVSTAVSYARYFYGQQLLYTVLSGLIKSCFILFYLSIFIGLWSRRLLSGTLVFIFMFYSMIVLVFIFECKPIRYYWEQLRNADNQLGTCYSINAWASLNGAVSIVLDIWILAIPLWEIRNLQLHWKKRFAVTIMFLTDAVITLASIARLQSLIKFSNSKNRTWDDSNVVLWSTIELNTGMACACLPTLRQIFIALWPSIFHSEQASNSPECYAENIMNTIGGSTINGRAWERSVALARAQTQEEHGAFPDLIFNSEESQTTIGGSEQSDYGKNS